MKARTSEEVNGVKIYLNGQLIKEDDQIRKIKAPTNRERGGMGSIYEGKV